MRACPPMVERKQAPKTTQRNPESDQLRTKGPKPLPAGEKSDRLDQQHRKRKMQAHRERRTTVPQVETPAASPPFRRVNSGQQRTGVHRRIGHQFIALGKLRSFRCRESTAPLMTFLGRFAGTLRMLLTVIASRLVLTMSMMAFMRVSCFGDRSRGGMRVMGAATRHGVPGHRQGRQNRDRSLSHQTLPIRTRKTSHHLEHRPNRRRTPSPIRPPSSASTIHPESQQASDSPASPRTTRPPRFGATLIYRALWVLRVQSAATPRTQEPGWFSRAHLPTSRSKSAIYSRGRTAPVRPV